MHDIEHPEMTRVNLTGYPRMQEMIVRAARCETCKMEIGFNDYYYRLYDEHDLCTAWCLARWLEKNGELVHVGWTDEKDIQLN